MSTRSRHDDSDSILQLPIDARRQTRHGACLQTDGDGNHSLDDNSVGGDGSLC